MMMGRLRGGQLDKSHDENRERNSDEALNSDKPNMDGQQCLRNDVENPIQEPVTQNREIEE